MLSLLTFEGLKPKCPGCSQHYILGEPPNTSNNHNRPYVMSCGHTGCHRCTTSLDRKCPQCQTTIAFSTVNLQLESQIRALAEKAKESEHIQRNLSYCLDCYASFNTADILSAFHEEHEVMDLGEHSESRLKEIIWLMDVVNRGNPVLGKWRRILQKVLEAALEFQTEIEVLEGAMKYDGLDISEEILNGLKNHFRSDEDLKHHNSPFIKSLLRIRSLQVAFGKEIFNLETGFNLKRENQEVNTQNNGVLTGAPKFSDSNESTMEDEVKCSGKSPKWQKTKLQNEVAFKAFLTRLDQDYSAGMYLSPSQQDLQHLPWLSLKVVSIVKAEGGPTTKPRSKVRFGTVKAKLEEQVLPIGQDGQTAPANPLPNTDTVQANLGGVCPNETRTPELFLADPSAGGANRCAEGRPAVGASEDTQQHSSIKETPQQSEDSALRLSRRSSHKSLDDSSQNSDDEPHKPLLFLAKRPPRPT